MISRLWPHLSAYKVSKCNKFLLMNSLSLELQNEDKLITKKQAAERLAVSTRTIDRMVATRRLEKIFVGASTRFRKSDIDRIVAKGI